MPTTVAKLPFRQKHHTLRRRAAHASITQCATGGNSRRHDAVALPPHCPQAQMLPADKLLSQHPLSSFAGRKHPICVRYKKHNTQKKRKCKNDKLAKTVRV